jgi:hypothetical protein
MTDNCSYQTSVSTSDQSDLKKEPLNGLEDASSVSESAATEMTFRSVMSQYEMEILTTLFPKCAQTLAKVLRNRPLRFEAEL